MSFFIWSDEKIVKYALIFFIFVSTPSFCKFRTPYLLPLGFDGKKVFYVIDARKMHVFFDRLLYELNPKDGKILDYEILPHPFAIALAIDDEGIWIGENNLEYPGPFIYRIDKKQWKKVKAFPSPAPFPKGRIGGLAFDGEYLWYCDSGFEYIYKLSPHDGRVLFSFPSPPYPTGLAFDGKYLWCASAKERRIYKICTNGRILASFPFLGRVPFGLTFFEGRLWAIDYLEDKILRLPF